MLFDICTMWLDGAVIGMFGHARSDDLAAGSATSGSNPTTNDGARLHLAAMWFYLRTEPRHHHPSSQQRWRPWRGKAGCKSAEGPRSTTGRYDDPLPVQASWYI